MNQSLRPEQSSALARADRSLRVTFVLPKFVDHPVGGYRVVVDYANQLVRRGHRCAIVLPLLGSWNQLSPRPAAPAMVASAREALRSRLGIPWAELERGVRVRPVFSGTPIAMPSGDVIVATAWMTAASVYEAPPRCGEKLYFIQHYETPWATQDPDAVRRSWELPMQKGVIAKWLVDLASEFGEAERTAYIPNGLDLGYYRIIEPPESRNPRRVGMLVHNSAWKGTDIGLAALKLARGRIADLEVELYGASGLSEPLPSWMAFAGTLAGQQVVDYFNRQAIFVHPSLTEGWPLPPAEAMACGTAVVCADNAGVMDYAVDGGNAVVVPRGSAEALADGIVKLVNQPELRIALARQAHQSIQAYSVEAATDRFEALISRLIRPLG